MINLVVAASEKEIKKILIQKPLVAIGRSRDSDICLDDTRVSRYHALLLKTKDGNIIIRDLGSQNGTFLNSKRIYKANINKADVIRIGRTKLSEVEMAVDAPLSKESWKESFSYSHESGFFQLATAQENLDLLPKSLKKTDNFKLFYEFVQNFLNNDILTLNHAEVLANLLQFAFKICQAKSGCIFIPDDEKYRPRFVINPKGVSLPVTDVADLSSVCWPIVKRKIKVKDKVRYGLVLDLPKTRSKVQEENEMIVDMAVNLSSLLLNYLSYHGAQNECIGNLQELCYWDVGFVTNNTRMLSLLDKVKRIADGGHNLLICGETGTGKEVVAKFAHENSPKRKKPMLSLNCTSLPDSLIDGLLFGVGKKIATGVEEYPGYFEQADGGTLFLDEVGDLPIEHQPKFLKVLEEKKVARLGVLKEEKSADVITYFATNKDLKRMVEAGKFREDLYYRISTFIINIPPLRDRIGDIPILVNYFLDRFDPNILGFSKSAINKLMAYEWPGNVRQLYTVVKRACVFCNGRFILPEHICFEDIGEESSSYLSTKYELKEIVKAHILRVLEIANGRKSAAAKMLGITRPTLNSKLKEYEIEKSDEDS